MAATCRSSERGWSAACFSARFGFLDFTAEALDKWMTRSIIVAYKRVGTTEEVSTCEPMLH